MTQPYPALNQQRQRQLCPIVPWPCKHTNGLQQRKLRFSGFFTGHVYVVPSWSQFLSSKLRLLHPPHSPAASPELQFPKSCWFALHHMIPCYFLWRTCPFSFLHLVTLSHPSRIGWSSPPSWRQARLSFSTPFPLCVHMCTHTISHSYSQMVLLSLPWVFCYQSIWQRILPSSIYLSFSPTRPGTP